MGVLEKINQAGIIPVIVIDNAEQAEALGEALLKGGISCVEITFRTKAAKEAIRCMKEKCPELTVGAGTVLRIEQAKEAVLAGAEFIVSPGSNPEVISYCMENGICIIPGVMTPSEIEQNLTLGINVMKFFPAEAAGGIKMIKALSAPYGSVKFMPTGGINQNNIEEYIKCPGVIACGGSWMADKTLLNNEEYARITELSKDVMDVIRRVTV